MPTINMPACTCPVTWPGYVTYCAAHNPNIACAGGGLNTYYSGTICWPPTPQRVELKPEDIEKIAQRVAELMRK